jgi:hypothetical protein
LIYFLVPRVPEVAYNNESTFTGDSANGLSFQTVEPVRFEFNGKINLAMIAKSSYVQPKTSIITVVIKDLSSAGNPVEVARGSNSDSVSISNKEYTPFSVDLNFRYSSVLFFPSSILTQACLCLHKLFGFVGEIRVRIRYGQHGTKHVATNGPEKKTGPSSKSGSLSCGRSKVAPEHSRNAQS